MTFEPHSAILQADGLNFSYPGRPLFTDLSAAIEAGITLIRGGDGSGKSTLMKLLAGALVPHSGQLHIKGTSLMEQPAAYKAQVFWADMRSDAFDQSLVQDYFDAQRSNFANFDDSVLAEVVAGLGLAEHLHKRLFMLSTGSKRKVFIAAALAAGAAVMLLDEPFAALDAVSIAYVVHWLQDKQHSRDQAWVIADYAAPEGLTLAQSIDLGD